MTPLENDGGKPSTLKRATLPAFVKPQLATLVDSVPRGHQWLHELKFDGYRMLCRIDDGRAVLLTREAQDWTARFKRIAQAASMLTTGAALLDGEVVAFDEQGRTDFQLLQNSISNPADENLAYFAFDLLYCDGKDWTATPLLARKQRLEELLKSKGRSEPPGYIRFSEHWIGQGDVLFAKACDMGLEGIVSKRADQPYHPGRSRNWLKIKCHHNQEFVIGGFTDPAGSRTGLGALLLGTYGDDQRLRYAGRVGTGFTSETLTELRARLDGLVQPESPFVDGPTGRQAKGLHWVKPELVGEVEFTGWTRDGVLRHPSFKGLREDKRPRQIRREEARSTVDMIRRKKNSKKNSEDAANGTEGIEIAGVKLTHPDRVLYPDQGITKRDLALYYEKVAEWILPHVEGRPLTLVRCPEGHDKQCFYQRHMRGPHDPAIIPIKVRERGSMVSYVSVDSLAGLIALVQLGVLELHAWGSRRGKINCPDRLIFDLDPDPAAPWKLLRDAARRLRWRLADVGLGSFVKTTGGKGLHVVVPIVPKENWNFAKEFAKTVAQSLVEEAPHQYIATMSKAKRKGKIFIDYLRNARTASAICSYSPRALSGAPVSVPLRWEEINDDPRSKFTIVNVPARISQIQDPWKGYEAARAPISRKMLKNL